jgi:hypothetical protein
MNAWKLVGLLALLGLLPSAVAAEWKPAAGPLATRWAADVSPANALPEYPRPQMVRPQWLNLNGLWQLDTAKADDALPIGKALPQQVLVPFPIESALSGVMKHEDRVWYRRTFDLPPAWKGRRVLLHFGAVDWEAAVFVNGQEQGTHRGGYDAFSFDITGALKAEGPQELIVKVFDPTDRGDQPRGKQVLKPGGIFYTPCTGIWQTVWLEPVPETSIGRLALVPDLDASCLRLTAETSGPDRGGAIEVVVRDGDREVARLNAKADEEVRVAIPKDALKRWSPESPFLYDLAVTLRKGNDSADSVTSYFGMRKIELAKDEKGLLRLRLNGQFVFHAGPLDQGFWPDGIYTAPTDAALRYDVEVTKQLGFNATRKHVKIEPERWYYWCDKLGLLVWQDMPSGNNRTAESKRQFEQELAAMVRQRGNHPSIVMWVPFNEGWGQHDTPRYVDLVKKLDPSRLVNNASGWTDNKVGDVNDIHAYPGPAAPKPETGRGGVLGEFGGLGLAIQGHTWQKEHWGYRGTANRDDLTRKYLALWGKVWGLRESQGLSAAIYTQITDVETECNGLLTYDRAVIKPDAQKAAAAAQGNVPQIKLATIVPTSQAQGLPWRYTFQKPAAGWQQPGFDDSSWKEGPGGFGTKGTPGAVVRTEWRTPDIWLRRDFEMPEVKKGGELLLFVHHDEDVEIYLNGILAGRANGFTTDYEEMTLTPEGAAALKPGKNLLSVHCKQTQGGQSIDVGIVRVDPQ